MRDMLDFPEKVESDAVPYTPRRTGTVAKLQLNPTTVIGRRMIHAAKMYRSFV